MIGKRPIDYHLKNFEKMGVIVTQENDFLCASVNELSGARIVLEYPSVGATEKYYHGNNKSTWYHHNY